MKPETRFGLVIVVGITFLMCIYFFFGPVYTIWSEARSGQARLAHQRYAKEIEVAAAQATFEASKLLAAADTVRAHGTARANEIIGRSISQNYLQWLWVQNLEKQEKSVIYVPSQNGIPIMPVQEATRLSPIIQSPN
jgi:hypothetical protein